MGRSIDLMAAINGPHPPPPSSSTSFDPPSGIWVQPKMWSYVRINHELLKKDPESVENVVPMQCWSTLYEAQEAAEEHWRIDEEEEVGQGYPPTKLK